MLGHNKWSSKAGCVQRQYFILEGYQRVRLLEFYRHCLCSHPREDVESEPGKDWQQFRCKVKKTNIIGLEEAELWEEQYVNASGTDAEDSLCIKTDSRKEKLEQIAKKSSFNKLFDEINSTSQQSELNESNTVYAISVEDTIEFNPKINGNIQAELPNKCCCDGSRFIEVHEEIKKNTERQERMLERFNAEFLQLKLTSDSIYKIMKDIQAHLGSAANKIDQVKTNVETVAFSERFLFPLNSQSAILEFNNELVNNDDYKTYLVKNTHPLSGSDGSEDGKNCARKLLSILFSKYVLTLFSWTGNIIPLPIGTREADSRWNQNKNEKFFKGHILKHAKQINEAHEKK
ncbi:hypothetical protein JTB14_015881 [Gonioctena quinquepunctata]|nr:hypothetical protein JTB14_015881 [Gonioctena quinquepunctata]